MNIKIMVADDDVHIRTLLNDLFYKVGYEVHTAENGEKALDLFYKHGNFDLIVLDVMMPELNGWEVLEAIRESSDVKILMLTALDDETYEMKGLNTGADEYISKPFSYGIFIARVKTLLKDIIKARQELIIIKDLRIDQASKKAFVMDTDCELNKKEYNLLMYLYENKGQTLTRERIIEHIWGYDFEGNPRTLDTHVKTLRAKLKDYGVYIKTYRGIGYRFESGDKYE